VKASSQWFNDIAPEIRLLAESGKLDTEIPNSIPTLDDFNSSIDSLTDTDPYERTKVNDSILTHASR
jgi:hypothetical protein